MIILDTTLRSIEVLLGGAVAANELPFAVSYVDISQTGIRVDAMRSSLGQSNGTSAVAMLDAPTDNLSRQVKYLSVYNADTSAATVTIQINDDGTKRVLVKVILDPGETLEYQDGKGWFGIDSAGYLKKTELAANGGTIPETDRANTFALLQTFSSGINFGQSTLNFYEAKNWTPVIRGGTTAGDLQYGNQVGRAVRIGQMVAVQADVRVTGVNSAPSGALEIAGLPWNATGAPGTDRAGFAISLLDNLNFDSSADDDLLVLQLRGGQSIIRFVIVRSSLATGGVNWADVTNTSDFKIGFSGVYTTGAF